MCLEMFLVYISHFFCRALPLTVAASSCEHAQLKPLACKYALLDAFCPNSDNCRSRLQHEFTPQFKAKLSREYCIDYLQKGGICSKSFPPFRCLARAKHHVYDVMLLCRFYADHYKTMIQACASCARRKAATSLVMMADKEKPSPPPKEAGTVPTKSPEGAGAVLTKSPEGAGAVPPKSPGGAGAVPTKSPPGTGAVPTKSPVEVVAVPTKSLEGVGAVPTKSLEGVGAVPTKSSEGAGAVPTKSPEGVGAVPTKSPEEAGAVLTKSTEGAGAVPHRLRPHARRRGDVLLRRDRRRLDRPLHGVSGNDRRPAGG